MDRTELLREREGYRDIVEDLKSELAAMTERLRVAEAFKVNLLTKLYNLNGFIVPVTHQDSCSCIRCKTHRKLVVAINYIERQSFLATPATGDVVVVRREDLPDPEKLIILAAWFDKKYPGDPKPEVQTELRKWANRLKAALGKDHEKL